VSCSLYLETQAVIKTIERIMSVRSSSNSAISLKIQSKYFNE